jgi:hypothetical protein
MAAAIDDIMESVANGVLRALDARSGTGERQHGSSTTELLESGFNVSIVVRCGGYPHGPIWDPALEAGQATKDTDPHAT